MRRRHRVGRSCLKAALFVVLLSACAHKPQVVYVGPPHARYDHNRNCPIESPVLRGGDPFLIFEEAYSPYGAGLFPTAEYAFGERSEDGLPTAHILPIFTGVELPLSAEPRVPDVRSDRSDLIDFLADGPLAQSGIQGRDIIGNLPELVESRYDTIFTLLESSETLAGGRDAVVAWAENENIRWTASIIDSRFPDGAFFERIALLFEDFWFILASFRPDGTFTRLVVVSQRPSKPELEKKTPQGSS